MNADERRFDPLIERILQAVFEVSNILGCGFLEKVYERALLKELALQGVRAKAQVLYSVKYKGSCIGEYMADLIVEDQIVLELKCVDRLRNEHTAVSLPPGALGNTAEAPAPFTRPNASPPGGTQRLQR